jgi:hypothetical protein
MRLKWVPDPVRLVRPRTELPGRTPFGGRGLCRLSARPRRVVNGWRDLMLGPGRVSGLPATALPRWRAVRARCRSSTSGKASQSAAHLPMTPSFLYASDSMNAGAVGLRVLRRAAPRGAAGAALARRRPARGRDPRRAVLGRRGGRAGRWQDGRGNALCADRRRAHARAARPPDRSGRRGSDLVFGATARGRSSRRRSGGGRCPRGRRRSSSRSRCTRGATRWRAS